MKNVNTNNNQEKKSNKKKWILIGAGGAALLVGGIFIGKKIGVKIGKDSADPFKDFFSDIPEGMSKLSVTYPSPKTDIGCKIDEELFTDIAMKIEDALLDNDINDFNLERSWDVAEGVVKNLKVTMDTIKA